MSLSQLAAEPPVVNISGNWAVDVCPEMSPDRGASPVTGLLSVETQAKQTPWTVRSETEPGRPQVPGEGQDSPGPPPPHAVVSVKVVPALTHLFVLYCTLCFLLVEFSLTLHVLLF